MSEQLVPLWGVVNKETEALEGVTYLGGGAEKYGVTQNAGDFASASAMETAYPAAANAGKTATAGGVAYVASGGIWSPVSGGPITEAQAISGSLAGVAIGEVRTLSSGANTGTQVRWFQPIGFSAPAWCWDVYPQSKYEG